MRIFCLVVIILLSRLVVIEYAKADDQFAATANGIVDQLIKTEVARDIDTQIQLFAPTVIEDGKTITREQFKKENLAYYKRWPIAQWRLLKPVEVNQVSVDSFEITYQASFRVESPERKKWSAGIIKSSLTISKEGNKFLIHEIKDHTSDLAKGDLLTEKTAVSAVAQSSNKEVSPDSPAVVYQSGLSKEPTFAKISNKGTYQVFANATEWCLVDRLSSIIIGHDSLNNVSTPFGDASFAPSDDVLAFLLGGNRGNPSLQTIDIADPFHIQNIEMGDTKEVGKQSVQFGGEMESPFAKWISGNGSFAVDKYKYNNKPISGSFPKNIAKNLHVTFEDQGGLFIAMAFDNSVVVYDISLFKKLLAVHGNSFQIDQSSKQIIVRDGNAIIGYNYLDANKKWGLTISSDDCSFSFAKGLLFTSTQGNHIQTREVESGSIKWDICLPGENNQKITRLLSSKDGRYIAVAQGFMAGGHVFVLNAQDGSTEFSVDSDGKMTFSDDASLFAYSVYSGYGSVAAAVVATTDWMKLAEIHEEKLPTYGIQDLCFDPNNKKLIYSLQAVDSLRSCALVDTSSPEPIVQEKSWSYAISHAGSNKLLLASDDEGFCNYWKLSDNSLKLKALLNESGCPLLITPDGFYLSFGSAFKSVGFRYHARGYPLEQFDLRLNRPDIVLERLRAPKEAIETAKSLRDKRLKRMGVTEEMLKPDFHLPELDIVGDVPATTPKDQLNLQIKATDDKYPLDRLRVYVNNVPVNGRDGELLRDQKTKSIERMIPIKLAAGRNKIQVSVLNSAGAESLYANAEVTCTAERPKPKLYAVALGVSQYDRPEWCLKYAAKDATDLIGKLKARAGSTYSEVKPLLLTDKEVTKESAAKIKEFLSGASIGDTVLIFMAGHGLLDDKYDYYFGTADIDPAKPSERGIPYEAIDNILAEVPSLKKALLMDTCHAGELDDDEKKELATSDGKGTLPAASSTASDSAIKGTVAMRAIGTRGMQVKAVEGAKGKSDWYEKLQDMFVDLRRGSGATVISSSQGAEYAFESSEQSNGLFTYALMEALDGKATPNKDGQITISAIGDYVKKRVQDLTKGKQNPNLRGVNLEEDFTLSSTK
jgi:WD40 repeat protein